MYLCYWHDMFILIECHSFLSPNKVNICLCGTSSYKNYTSYRFGVIPSLPHELYLSFSVKKRNSVVHWCAHLVQPVFFFLLVNNILIILNQEHCANFTTWTRPNSCTINQILCISCEPQQKSQCISHVYEEIDEKCIRVTKPPMYLHHRKLQLQFMQLRRSLEMQLIVAFKVLWKKTALPVLQLFFGWAVIRVVIFKYYLN